MCFYQRIRNEALYYSEYCQLRSSRNKFYSLLIFLIFKKTINPVLFYKCPSSWVIFIVRVKDKTWMIIIKQSKMSQLNLKVVIIRRHIFFLVQKKDGTSYFCIENYILLHT